MISDAEFEERYGSDEKCAAIVEAWRWPVGWRCPHCSFHRYTSERGQYRCGLCHQHTSLTSGTLFSGTKVGLAVWFKAMRAIEADSEITAAALAKHIPCSTSTAWMLRKKLTFALSVRERPTAGWGSLESAFLGPSPIRL